MAKRILNWLLGKSEPEPVNFWRGDPEKVAREDEMAEYAKQWNAKREAAYVPFTTSSVVRRPSHYAPFATSGAGSSGSSEYVRRRADDGDDLLLLGGLMLMANAASASTPSYSSDHVGANYTSDGDRSSSSYDSGSSSSYDSGGGDGGGFE